MSKQIVAATKHDGEGDFDKYRARVLAKNLSVVEGGELIFPNLPANYSDVGCLAENLALQAPST